jgi:hypothetical protein
MSPLIRLRQGLTALRPEPPAQREALLSRFLTAEQAAVFHRLSTFDQSHLCRVCDRLLAQGEQDRDLLIAALLHDVGKIDETGTVLLPHRVARVVLRRFSPSLLSWLARLPASRWRAGFVLAVHHPALGAGTARQLGCSERTCWLIAHHEDKPAPNDDQLRRLIAADHVA